MENFSFSFIKSLIGGRYHQFAPLVTAPVSVEEVVLAHTEWSIRVTKNVSRFRDYQFAPLVTAPVSIEEVVLLTQNGPLGLQRTFRICRNFEKIIKCFY